MLSLRLVAAGRDRETRAQVEVPDHGADVDVVLGHRSLVLLLEGLAVLGRAVAVRGPALRRRRRLVHVLRALVLKHLGAFMVVFVRKALVDAVAGAGCR